MASPTPPNHIYEHCSGVLPEEREALFRQRGCVLWFTGLSGSGKSTVAHAVEHELIRMGHAAYVLDGDNVRRRLNANLGFSDEDRHENIRRVGEVAHLFAEAGLVCLTSFISPFRADRELARSIIGHDRMLEVHLSTSIEQCEARDPKGLYKKARTGEIPEFTGVSSPYEPPEHPELSIDTSACTVEQSVQQVLAACRERGYLKPE